MTTGKAETFKIEPRKIGKHNSKVARNGRMVPAVIYGPKQDNTNVLCTELFIDKHRAKKWESVIFKTESEDSKLKGINVMLKKIQYHPVTNRPVHVDFYALDMTEKIKVKVPVKYNGEPVGCKEEGGVRQIILFDIELECSPADIPEQIDVAIEHLKLNESIHVSDVTFPDTVKVLTAPERTMITVGMPKEEKEEPVAAEGAEGAEGAAPADGAAAPAEGEKKAEEKK